jgi:hypothetical protein
MDANRDMKIRELQVRLARGDYRINPAAVADAVVRRTSGLDLACAYEGPTVETPARRRSGVRLVGVITPRSTGRSAVAA